MRDLDVLAAREASTLQITDSLRGTMEERGQQLQDRGVYAQYRSIFGGYLELLMVEEARLEALKRSVFLAWYRVSEPPCYTGLQLPDEGCHRAFQALGSAFERGEFDEELRWMVPFYYLISDFAFPDLAPFPGLALFLADSDPQAYRARCGSAPCFEGRGQMGCYWRSLLKGSSTPG